MLKADNKDKGTELLKIVCSKNNIKNSYIFSFSGGS